MITNRNARNQYDFCNDMVIFQTNSWCRYRYDEIVTQSFLVCITSLTISSYAFNSIFFKNCGIHNKNYAWKNYAISLDINYQYFFTTSFTWELIHGSKCKGCWWTLADTYIHTFLPELYWHWAWKCFWSFQPVRYFTFIVRL